MGLIERIEKYLTDFIVFSDPQVAFPLALWAIGTHCYLDFDAYPYLVITSATKRSGKTRTMEMLTFIVHNPIPLTAPTPATVFRAIELEEPTILCDEAETLSSEAATNLRATLNVGYRKGATVPRTYGQTVKYFNTYCPKMFVLIGDVYDTLRDRSIVINLNRAEPPERFTMSKAKGQGRILHKEIETTVRANQSAIHAAFIDHEGIPYLQDRDEEIWTSLFCLCEVLCPDRVEELQTISVDLATEKTAEARKYLQLHKSENAAQRDEYAERLLLDLYELCVKNGKYLPSAAALDMLKANPTSPWRKYRGKGLDARTMSTMLDKFGVGPVRIGIGTGRGRPTVRGYRQSDIETALQKLGRKP